MRLGEIAPVLQRFGNPCWRKERHATEGAAEAAQRSLERRDLAKDLETINVYHCAYCGAWHVGHSSLRGRSE